MINIGKSNPKLHAFLSYINSKEDGLIALKEREAFCSIDELTDYLKTTSYLEVLICKQTKDVHLRLSNTGKKIIKNNC